MSKHRQRPVQDLDARLDERASQLTPGLIQPQLPIKRSSFCIESLKTLTQYCSCWLGIQKRNIGNNCGVARGLVVRVLDSQLGGCEFNSCPPRCRVTTIGKLFTPVCVCRLQWSSGRVLDCGVRRPGLNLTTGSCVYHNSHCDIQPWARAAHPYCSASTWPSTLRGTA